MRKKARAQVLVDDLSRGDPEAMGWLLKKVNRIADILEPELVRLKTDKSRFCQRLFTETTNSLIIFRDIAFLDNILRISAFHVMLELTSKNGSPQIAFGEILRWLDPEKKRIFASTESRPMTTDEVRSIMQKVGELVRMERMASVCKSTDNPISESI